MTDFRWGTVTAVSPLRVQLDGDTAALPITPDSLVDPSTLVVGDRVRCEISANRIVVHGRGGGLAAPTGSYFMLAGRTVPAGFLKADGSAVSRVTYAALFACLVPSLGTCTMTIATPGVITKTAHGLVGGDRVYLTTTGALPTGLTANTLYYVLAASLTANTFRVSLTDGGAAINTSGTQSGVHTLVLCPYGLGDGSTTFNLPDIGDYVLVGQKTGSAEFGSIGRSQGEKTHTLAVAELPPHAHQPGPGGAGSSAAGNTGDIPARSNAATADANFRSGTTLYGGSAYASAAVSAGLAHNNIQPSRAVLVVVKT